MSVQRELDISWPPRPQAPSLSQEHQSCSTHKGGTSSCLYTQASGCPSPPPTSLLCLRQKQQRPL